MDFMESRLARNHFASGAFFRGRGNLALVATPFRPPLGFNFFAWVANGLSWVDDCFACDCLRSSYLLLRFLLLDVVNIATFNFDAICY
jgi:hypothetical protein